MDAKRGDIGSTMDGYFGAWLGQSAPFHSDALTVSPYLGFESLQPVLAAAHERGKGVFVLAATSNPEARKLQLAVAEGISVANSIWQSLGKINRTLDGAQPGSFGAVIGATVNPNDYGIELTASPTTPILAPGFGAQGAALGQLQRLFGSASDRVIATVSRSVLQHGALGLETAIDAAKTELANQTIAAGHDE
jgi:orotidine-5'-phosphate decarboxylase